MLFIGLLVQSIVLSHILDVDVGEMFVYMAGIEMFMILFSVLNTTKATITSIKGEVESTLQAVRNRLEEMSDSESDSESEEGSESDLEEIVVTTPVFMRNGRLDVEEEPTRTSEE